MALTFLAVHAHPDDEASSTGGLLRLLANEGVRTVLVTCTNGEYGDAPGGLKPTDDGHDPDEVAEMRRGELDEAAAILGVSRLVRLGYRDSGMMGWAPNEDPRSFWSTPVELAADALGVVLAEERPQVIVTYNEVGFYGHPDHIQAHRITQAAIERLDYEPTLYYNAIPASVMKLYEARWAEEERRRREADAAKGIVREADPAEEPEGIDMATPDELIDVSVDISSVAGAKYDALAAHHSQIGGSFWIQQGREAFVAESTREWVVRARNPLGLSQSASDIFVGYR